VSPTKRRRDDVQVRLAGKDDEEDLSEFHCSSGLDCEEDVEKFLQARAIEMVRSEVADYRMLLAYCEDDLAGVVAHHIDPLTLEDGEILMATRLHVLAVAPAYRGTVFEDGTRLSDALLANAVEDASKRRQSNVFTAIVANENDRSLTMLERLGPWSQVAYDYLHVRLTKRLE
jgi:GNAT superfamily N-acetyltransferase